MSDHTPSTPAENTDLTAASVAASNALTPGEKDASSPVDRPSPQSATSQDPLEKTNLPKPDNSPFSGTDWEAFKSLTAELKLSDEQIEKLVAFSSEFASHQQQDWQDKKRAKVASWANQTRALYGAGLDEEIAFALQAANTFGGPELRALLEETGLGNHPVMIRTLSGIGRCISEEAVVGGVPAAPQDKTFAEALYGRKN